MTDRHCTAPGCGKLLVHRRGERGWLQRNTCDKSCRKRKQNALDRERREASKREERVRDPTSWPHVSDPIEADFAPFDHDPGDNRGYLPARPPTVILKQSSIA